MQHHGNRRPAGIVRPAGKRIILFCTLACAVFGPACAQAFWPFSAWFGDAPSAGSTINTRLNQETAAQAGEMAVRIKTMSGELIRHLTDPESQKGLLAEGLAVCTFVDLKNLSRTSSFGRYLAEQLMTDFQHQGYSVMEIRKSDSILVREKSGEYGLSRDSDEINHSVAAGAILTGTYTLAGDNIMINARIINNRDARLLSSATAIFPRNRLAAILLKDMSSASASASGQNQVIYMKKLEL